MSRGLYAMKYFACHFSYLNHRQSFSGSHRLITRIQHHFFGAHAVLTNAYFKRHFSSTYRFSLQNTSQSLPDVPDLAARCLKVNLSERQIEIPYIWLRDHCRCEKCYNHGTFQKNVDSFSLLGDLVIQDVQIQGDDLTLKWQDGHISAFSLRWLENNYFCSKRKVERVLWDGLHMSELSLPFVKFDQYMESEEGLSQALRNIIQYGFFLVKEVPVSKEGTVAAAQRISFLLETVFGNVSILTPNMEHSDTAYSTVALSAHTDGTYYTVPAGIQVFHCLKHDGDGGSTLLVDGFNAAEKLRSSNSEFFDILVKTLVPHEYIEGTKHHLYCLGTVLSTDPFSGQMQHIRFNPYDRAPLNTVPAEIIPRFYASYEALTQIIHSKESEFWIKLQPGMVLFIDNWRILHGRSAFTGYRALCGCYLPRDEWMSKARIMGL